MTSSKSPESKGSGNTQSGANIPPGPVWPDLFDVNYADTCCDTWAENIICDFDGSKELASVIRRFVCDPLADYMQSVGENVGTDKSTVKHAELLAKHIGDLCRSIESGERERSWTLIADVQPAWMRFILHGAAPAVYVDVAEAIKRNRRRGAMLTAAKKTPAVHNAVVALFDRLIAAGKSRSDAIGIIGANKDSPKVRQVRNIIKRSRPDN